MLLHPIALKPIRCITLELMMEMTMTVGKPYGIVVAFKLLNGIIALCLPLRTLFPLSATAIQIDETIAETALMII